MTPFVNLIIISASGFSVKEHHQSAIRTMHQRFRIDHQANFPLAEIIYRAWNAPWKSLARRLHQVSIPSCPTIFVGHSWGCGHAFRQFEKEWHHCRRIIDHAFLIDPVPRPFRFLPLRVANVFAVFSRGVFRVDHARSVYTWRQVNGLPMGRRVVVPDAHSLTSTVMGSRRNVEKRAPRAHASEIKYDPIINHNSIDDKTDVQLVIHEEIDAYINVLMQT